MFAGEISLLLPGQILKNMASGRGGSCMMHWNFVPNFINFSNSTLFNNSRGYLNFLCRQIFEIPMKNILGDQRISVFCPEESGAVSEFSLDTL
jgi:hypothetical protein